MSKNIGKNIRKNVSGKYSQELLDHVKQSAADAFKTTSKRAIQKTAETAGDLKCNKIVNKIMGVSKNLQQNNSETVSNEHDLERPKERYISPEKSKKLLMI